jgi:D-sedoheptulose 7-phosphate isomerase
MYARLVETYSRGGKVLVCGNGGSAADAEHLVGELMKGYLAKRPVPTETRDNLLALFPMEGQYLADHLQGALPTISLVSQSSLITAYANDVAADMIFAQQVYGYGKPGDALLAISTSGNSKNIVHAAQVARAQGVIAIGMTGASGGALRNVCYVTVRVPSDVTAEIQERQLAIYHAVCAMLEQEFFPT